MSPPRSNLARIIAVLSAFDDRNTPLPTHELISRLELGRSTGFGLLRAMVVEGWLERTDHGVLRLGPRAADLAWSPLEGVQVAAPVLRTGPTTNTARIPSLQGAAPDWTESLVEMVDTTRFSRSGPVRIGFSNASLGNPWRRAMRASLDYVRRLHHDRIDTLLEAEAGDNPSRQQAQIEEMIAKRIDLLVISTSSVTDVGLSQYLTHLADDGFPIVAVDRRPGNAGALTSFVTASDHRIGQMSALWLAEHLHGTGRIWMLPGLSGTSPALRRHAAARAMFQKFPGVEITAELHTDWTEASGYRAAERLLDRSGAAPDAVWCDSGLQGLGALRRFLEVGDDLPAFTGGDVNGMYKLCLQYRVPFAAIDYPAAMGGRALEVTLDILSGTPVQRRVEVPLQVVLPRGLETESVKADLWAERHVGWDLADTVILSQGPGARTVIYDTQDRSQSSV